MRTKHKITIELACLVPKETPSAALANIIEQAITTASERVYAEVGDDITIQAISVTPIEVM